MSKPTDSAPAYDDLFHSHPANQYPLTGASNSVRRPSLNPYAPARSPHPQYFTVSQEDDNPSSTTDDTASHSHTALQTFGVKPQEHTHCDACDTLQQQRERQQHSRRTCGMVALVFIALFLCSAIVAVVAINEWSRVNRHH
ncbi:hypothetical protein MMC13_004632 [Lambiella insularis]|nr:hypothetical protein [Lambiella insularis]